MNIEYEATFTNIHKAEMRERLKKVGATLIRTEYLQKRVVFNLPKGHEINGGWIRVRDEGDKVTLSLKIVDGNNIENQKEIYLKIDNFEQAEILLETLGCERKAFQESKRELWKIEDVEVTLDEWPFLEPFVEIEGRSEEAVKLIAMKLDLDYSKALFCAVDTLYSNKYGISKDIINDKTPEIIFNGKNPFIKQ